MEWDTPVEDESGNSLEPSGVDNRYSYNGKELEDNLGINWHYYGFRMYDPAIARFTGVDPIADQFPHLSTFNYADNNPIGNIDLHGLQSFPMYSANNQKPLLGDGQKYAKENPKTAAAIAAAPAVGLGLGYAVARFGVTGVVSFVANEAKDEALSQATGGLSDAVDATKLIKNGIEKGIKSIDDILSDATPGRKTKGKTKQFEKDGGFDQASKEFDSLDPTDVKEIDTKFGTGRTGTLSDGTTVTVRPGSSDGRPTLEVRNPENGRGKEIRYNEPEK